MPLHPRIILWIAFAVAILAALVLAFVTLAGNTSPDRQRWPLFVGVFFGVLALQGGYLLAPFTLGRSGWLFWVTLALMVPALFAFTAAIASPLYLAVTATRPDGASGWRTIAGIGPVAVIGLVIYVLPPVMMVVYRSRGF
ncbi:MAG: hypothetical protein PSX37_03650 [bacterium]|nr:hypothetical protein [bacterium]